MSTPSISPLSPAPAAPDETLLAMLGLHPKQLELAQGLHSGAIHPQTVLDAVTPKPAPTPDAAGLIAPPPDSSGVIAPIKAAPQMPTNVTPPTKLSSDQAELERLQKTGSGISQFQQRHPIIGGIARVAAAIGSAMFPSIAANIPGTDLHHQVLERQQSGRVGQDVAMQNAEAGQAHTAAETEEAQARTKELEAQTAAAGQPKPKEEAWKEFPQFTDVDGTPLKMEANSGQVVRTDGKPPTGFKVAQLKSEKPDSPEQQFIDEHLKKNPGSSIADAEAAYTKVKQPPQHDPRQMIVGPDNTVIELKPGMKVPTGSKTVTGELTNKPTADEQRRADLAGNLNENLNQLEDIVTRRPELFGPLAGRWTELKGKFGSDDPDIAALQTLEHQIGMAQISAHGMRSAHGIEGAAQSIMNGLHSGPTALQGAIKTVRNSVQTFSQDVAKAKGEAAPEGNGPAVGTVEGGYKFKGGNPADQNNWEKVK